MNRETRTNTELIPIAEGAPDTLNTLSLVLEAIGIDYWLDQDGGRLLVTAEDASAARFHLDQYRQENRNWPPPPPPL